MKFEKGDLVIEKVIAKWLCIITKIDKKTNFAEGYILDDSESIEFMGLTKKNQYTQGIDLTECQLVVKSFLR